MSVVTCQLICSSGIYAKMYSYVFFLFGYVASADAALTCKFEPPSIHTMENFCAINELMNMNINIRLVLFVDCVDMYHIQACPDIDIIYIYICTIL